MNARDIFGLVIRILGLFGVLWGVFYFVSVAYLLMGGRSTGYSPYEYLAAGCVFLILGIYFLRGAKHVVRFAYPDCDKAPQSSDDNRGA